MSLMSKAFVKEEEGTDEEPDAQAARKLPSGKNYITPGGYARLEAELRKLVELERPEVVRTVAWAASLGDRSENADYIYGKRRLREIDRRIRFLSKRMDAAGIVDPAQTAPEKRNQVLFGATVKVKDEEERTRV